MRLFRNWLATLFLTTAAVCTVEAADALRLEVKEYASEVHPGPRLGCARCAAMATRLRGFSGEVLVPAGGDIRMTRAWAFDAGAKNALVLANYSGKPEIGLAQLEKKPHKFIVIHDTPIDADQIVQMHELDPTEDQVAELAALNKDIPRLLAGADDIIDLKTHAGKVEKSLRDALRSRGKDDLIVVLSHVTKGKLRLHDGTEVAMSDIESPGMVYVVGCNTLKPLRDRPRPGLGLGVGRRLLYEEGTASARLMLTQVKQGGTNRDVLLRLQNDPPNPDPAKRPKNEKDELRQYKSPEDVEKPSEKELQENEKKGAAAPAIGIVKAGVIGIGVADQQGEFFAALSRMGGVELAGMVSIMAGGR